MDGGRGGEAGGVKRLCVCDCVLFVDAGGDEMCVCVCVWVCFPAASPLEVTPERNIFSTSFITPAVG